MLTHNFSDLRQLRFATVASIYFHHGMDWCWPRVRRATLLAIWVLTRAAPISEIVRRVPFIESLLTLPLVAMLAFWPAMPKV